MRVGVGVKVKVMMIMMMMRGAFPQTDKDTTVATTKVVKRRKKSSSSDHHHNNKRKKKSRSRKDRKRKHSSRRKKKKSRKYSSSSSSDESSSPSDSDESSSSNNSEVNKKTTKVVNERLLQKLSARGETLEEREERRSRKRAERIAAHFGYTAEDNPFRDPNLHEPFSWKKKQEEEESTKKGKAGAPSSSSRVDIQTKTISEIEKVRSRRKNRELQLEEMDRIKAEESRMREQENYDDWIRKEEEFHLNQQKQRSAIRLVEGREKPIDILAKNVLLFFGSSSSSSSSSASDDPHKVGVKYREKYNALEEMQALEAELDEPQNILKNLRIDELRSLLEEVQNFCQLEKEAGSSERSEILEYWEALEKNVKDEITCIQTGGENGTHSKMARDVYKMLDGKSKAALIKMKEEIIAKLSSNNTTTTTTLSSADLDYWRNVLQHLEVYRAKQDLSEMHSKMLVKQLEKLEKRKEALAEESSADILTQKMDSSGDNNTTSNGERPSNTDNSIPSGLPTGDLEEELGLTSEVVSGTENYVWQERYRPRKPRYFNRVKTGYDWNKYNQTHYDHDNPPPKTVQGYKFNIFYPDLIDKTKTPQYYLEACRSGNNNDDGGDNDSFCIIRFSAGPPYEDVAFKIINREWNKSRKRGFRCTFERGVLSLYFNFQSHWYRS